MNSAQLWVSSANQLILFVNIFLWLYIRIYLMLVFKSRQLYLFIIVTRYISALLMNEEPASLQNAVASGWPASLHLIGKVRLLSWMATS